MWLHKQCVFMLSTADVTIPIPRCARTKAEKNAFRHIGSEPDKHQQKHLWALKETPTNSKKRSNCFFAKTTIPSVGFSCLWKSAVCHHAPEALKAPEFTLPWTSKDMPCNKAKARYVYTTWCLDATKISKLSEVFEIFYIHIMLKATWLSKCQLIIFSTLGPDLRLRIWT